MLSLMQGPEGTFEEVGLLYQNGSSDLAECVA